MRGLDDAPTQLLTELGERFERHRRRLLLPEGGVGHRRTCVAEHAARRRASSRSTPACSSPRRYETWEQLEERLGITVEVARHRARRAGRAARRRLWNEPDRCCDRARSRPLRDVLAERDAWITGMRREQSADARRHAELAAGTPSAACGSPTRWPTGPRRTSGTTSPSTTCPTTRCTTRATPRSAARPAPARRRARGPLGRHRQDRVRPARRLTFATSPWTRWSSPSASGVGILVGLTGIGGGSLMTPLLILVVGVQARRRRSAPTSPTARSPRRSAAGATSRKGTVDLGVSQVAGRSARCPARSSASWLLDAASRRSHDTSLLSGVAVALLLVGARDPRPRAVPAARPSASATRVAARRGARKVARRRPRRSCSASSSASPRSARGALDRPGADPGLPASRRTASSAPTSSTPRSCCGPPASPTGRAATSTSG